MELWTFSSARREANSRLFPWQREEVFGVANCRELIVPVRHAS
jgi:hypothetical protein